MYDINTRGPTVQHDPLIAIYQEIDDLHRAEYAADDAGNTNETWRCIETARPLVELARDLAPQSAEGAVLKLRSVVETSNVHDEFRASAAIAKAANAVIRAVERGTLTGRHMAALRAMLPHAETIDGEISSSLAPSIVGALAWLAKPKLV